MLGGLGQGVAAGPGANVLLFEDGQLTVRTHELPLSALLLEVARQSGLSLKTDTDLDRRVTMEFHNLTLDRALRRILHQQSFVLQGGPDGDRVLWILHSGDGASPDRGAFAKGGSYFKNGYSREQWLQSALMSTDLQERSDAVDALHDRGNAALGDLSRALEDDASEVRATAVDTLGDIGGATAAQTLAVALADSDPRVREAAVDALGEIGGPIAIGLLQQALVDGVGFVRKAAAETLESLGRRSRSNLK